MLQHGFGFDAAAVCIWGDVTIAPDVAIAPGAVLEAAPGSRLIIQERVCIGSGVIVQAVWGELRLEVGASLGAGVLLWGRGSVGSHACIGAESTVLNPQVAADQVIPARSLLGDPQRSAPEPAMAGNLGAATSPLYQGAEGAGTEPQNGAAVSAEAALGAPAIVYGREQVTQLIHTLFPHRRSLDSAPGENESRM